MSTVDTRVEPDSNVVAAPDELVSGALEPELGLASWLALSVVCGTLSLAVALAELAERTLVLSLAIVLKISLTLTLPLALALALPLPFASALALTVPVSLVLRVVLITLPAEDAENSRDEPKLDVALRTRSTNIFSFFSVFGFRFRCWFSVFVF